MYTRKNAPQLLLLPCMQPKRGIQVCHDFSINTTNSTVLCIAITAGSHAYAREVKNPTLFNVVSKS